MLRRTIFVGLAAFIVVAATAVFTPSAGAASACGGACHPDGSTTLHETGAKPSTSCVHDPACGGGAALAQAGTPLFLAVAAGALVFAVALMRRRFRVPRASVARGTLLANRLFHPPQFLLGS
jgi:hypothetical protein